MSTTPSHGRETGLVSASIELRGDAQSVLEVAGAAGTAKLECEVFARLRLRPVGKYGSVFMDRERVLPSVAGGDCEAALQHIATLERQTKISSAEAQEASEYVQKLAALTRNAPRRP